ncbi:MAG: copper amine oxidase N-terminal domain-containing protein, partial [Clostridiales Family XIII bacterium]|nr:copper amine oxidase N-terminal domain-containing protein [Clostridiales Family XIII bacterium]
ATDAPAVPLPDEYEYDEGAPWLYYDMTEEEYYEAFEPWRAKGQTEEEYWNEYEKNLEKEARERQLRAAGFTDTDIPNVVVNGQALNFTGAKPLARDGVTMVPARAVLEALGAELSYDGKTKTLTDAAGGATVAFAAGNRTVAVTKDGQTSELEPAAAPFLDAAAGSIYVPLRALTEGLGLELYWDDFYRVAEVVDRESLIAEIDADFTVFNALIQSELAGAAGARALEQTEKTDVNFTADLEGSYNPYYYRDEDGLLDGMKGTAKLAGAFTLLSGLSGLDLKGEAKLAISGFDDFLGDLRQDPEFKPLLANLEKGVPLELLINYDEAVFYLQLPLLAYIDPLFDKDTWLASRAEDYGIDIGTLTAPVIVQKLLANDETITIGELLYLGFFGSYAPASSSFGYVGGVGPSYGYSYSGGSFNRAKNLLRTARLLAPFVGDLYMEKEGDTHVISLNRLELFNIIKRLSAEESMNIGDLANYAEFLKTVPSANYSLRIREADGVPASAELTVNLKLKIATYDDEAEVVEFRYNMRAEPQKASADYSITVDAPSEAVEGTLRVHADGVSAPTDETPRPAPPAGSKVVSTDEL